MRKSLRAAILLVTGLAGGAAAGASQADVTAPGNGADVIHINTIGGGNSADIVILPTITLFSSRGADEVILPDINTIGGARGADVIFRNG